MAGIDKIWANSWKQYWEIKEFVDSYNDLVKDEYGNIFRPSWFLFDYTEDEFKTIEKQQRDRFLEYYKNPENYKKDKEWFTSLGDPDWEPNIDKSVEVTIFCSPTYFDVWLIRNCKIDFIQSRLKQQYGSSYESILNRTSIFDTTILKRSHKFSIINKNNTQIRNSKIWWWIQVDEVPEDSNISLGYNENSGMWYDFSECREITSNTFEFHGNLTKRKLTRLMKKWNLPSGVVLSVRGIFKGFEIKSFKIRVK